MLESASIAASNSAVRSIGSTAGSVPATIGVVSIIGIGACCDGGCVLSKGSDPVVVVVSGVVVVVGVESVVAVVSVGGVLLVFGLLVLCCWCRVVGVVLLVSVVGVWCVPAPPFFVDCWSVDCRVLVGRSSACCGPLSPASFFRSFFVTPAIYVSYRAYERRSDVYSPP